MPIVRVLAIMCVLAVMCVLVRWRMQLGEVMDQVWTRDRQEREECYEGSTRTETHALDAHVFPP